MVTMVPIVSLRAAYCPAAGYPEVRLLKGAIAMNSHAAVPNPDALANEWLQLAPAWIQESRHGGTPYEAP